MATKQAFKRVIKKLSAVRATLRNDEREALDNIIVEEVVAHQMNLGKVSGKAAAKTSAKASAKAHAMNLGKVSGKAAGKTAGKTSGKAA